MIIHCTVFFLGGIAPEEEISLPIKSDTALHPGLHLYTTKINWGDVGSSYDWIKGYAP